MQEKGSEEDFVNCSVVSAISLRQEAIKWVKELDSELLTISNGKAPTEEGHESYNVKQSNKSALILWIKHFFNLTKEELK